MMNKIKVLSKPFLQDYRVAFKTDYLPLYRMHDKEGIKALFAQEGAMIEEDIVFEYAPLIHKNPNDEVPSPQIALKNAKILWKSLSHLTPQQAESEALWVGLANTYYLDYHLAFLEGRDDASITSLTTFVNGTKRSLIVHTLAYLWWTVYLFLDEGAENEWKYVDFILGNVHRGNLTLMSSNNFISNKKVAMGFMDAVYSLVNQGATYNRELLKKFSVLLNQVGTVRILDAMEREEIRDLLLASYKSGMNIDVKKKL